MVSVVLFMPCDVVVNEKLVAASVVVTEDVVVASTLTGLDVIMNELVVVEVVAVVPVVSSGVSVAASIVVVVAD